MAETTDLKKVWMVVSPHNPFKPSKGLLHEFDRYDMVRAAVYDHYKIEASDVEFHLPKPSYTIHTLVHLSEKHPDKEFKVNGVRISYIRYADHTVIIAETEDDLQTMMDEIHQVSLLYGMKMNLKKTTGMVIEKKNCTICNILLNEDSIQQVHEFVYLEVLITDDGFCNKEIK